MFNEFEKYRQHIREGVYNSPRAHKMGRKTRGEVWKSSYIAWLLEFKGINYTLAAHVLDISYQILIRKLKNPERFSIEEVKKLANLLNMTFFEMVAIVDMVHDRDAAKYCAEYYYKEALKSKHIPMYGIFKRLGVLDDDEITPADMSRALDSWKLKNTFDGEVPKVGDPKEWKKRRN